MIQNTSSHTIAAMNVLAHQYRDKTNIQALVNLMGARCDELELAFMRIRASLDFSTSTDTNLTRAGKIVGQRRLAMDDEEFRHWVKARVLINRSGGSTDELIDICEEVDLPVAIEEYPQASALVTVIDPAPNSQAWRVCRALAQAKAGGVKLLFNHQTVPDEEVFCFDSDLDGDFDRYEGFFDEANPWRGGTLNHTFRYAMNADVEVCGFSDSDGSSTGGFFDDSTHPLSEVFSFAPLLKFSIRGFSDSFNPNAIGGAFVSSIEV